MTHGTAQGSRYMAPRKEQQIFQATLELLAAKGYEGLTVEGVAERSEVNKTTIYRWWPSKAALLAAALVKADLLAMEPPDTGSLRGDLEALVQRVVALLTRPRRPTSRWPRSAPPHTTPSSRPRPSASSPTGSRGRRPSSTARDGAASSPTRRTLC